MNEICKCIVFKIFFFDKSNTGAETSTTATESVARKWIFKQKTLCNVSMMKKIPTKKPEQRFLLHLSRYLLYCLRCIISENHMPMSITTTVAVLSKKERREGLIQIIDGEQILS